MNVLLGGSRGFIGSHLEEFFQRNNCHIIKISSPNSKSNLGGDTFSLEEIERKIITGFLRIDLVINTVQRYSRERSSLLRREMYEANVNIPKKLFELAFLCNAEFIHFSSYLEYTRIQSDYIDQKKTISKWLDLQPISRPRKRIILGDTFGPKDNRDKILNLIRQAAITGVDLQLESPHREFRLLHINDLILNLMNLKESGVYNFLHPKSIEMHEIVEIHKNATKNPIQITWNNQKSNTNDINEYMNQIAKASDDFELFLPERIENQIFNFFSQET